MPHRISWINRLRIERFVWTLNQRIYDLPRASRIAHRREVRTNLLAAAADIGTTPPSAAWAAPAASPVVT